jgi:ribosomal protein L4
MHRLLQIPGQRKDTLARALVVRHRRALVARHHSPTNPLVRHGRRTMKTRQPLD